MSSNKSVSAFPDGDNLFQWVGTVEGSADTVYEGLTYRLRMEFPADYPFSAPTITFTTPCFHPNVDQFGNICLDILKVLSRLVGFPPTLTALSPRQLCS